MYPDLILLFAGRALSAPRALPVARPRRSWIPLNRLNPRTKWEAVLGSLELQVSRPSYATWLKDTTGLSFEDNRMVVGVPSAFVAQWLEQRMSSLIEATLSQSRRAACHGALPSGRGAVASCAAARDAAQRRRLTRPPGQCSSVLTRVRLICPQPKVHTGLLRGRPIEPACLCRGGRSLLPARVGLQSSLPVRRRRAGARHTFYTA